VFGEEKLQSMYMRDASTWKKFRGVGSPHIYFSRLKNAPWGKLPEKMSSKYNIRGVGKVLLVEKIVFYHGSYYKDCQRCVWKYVFSTM
jgi:hypothetical protein